MLHGFPPKGAKLMLLPGLSWAPPGSLCVLLEVMVSPGESDVVIVEFGGAAFPLSRDQLQLVD